MSEYRIYLNAEDGHIVTLRAFVCDNDADATVLANQLVDGHAMELWSYARFVTRLNSTGNRGAVPGTNEAPSVLESDHGSGPVNTPDQDTLRRAIEDARCILQAYMERGQSDEAKTVQSLLASLDKNEVVHALDRLKRPTVMRLVE
jgi:hypothetical protein